MELDMPPVIELRRQLFPEDDRCQVISASVTDPEWISQVYGKKKPVLILAEGLLMYLDEPQVRELVHRLHDAFPGAVLAADIFSKLTARSASRHPSLHKTQAGIGFGIDDSLEIESWAPGIKLLEEWSFTQDPRLDQLSPGYRLAYKLAGASKTIRMALRVITLKL
jgi:O-methyltransferase involved in polyketide biosynthesis